jgi:hypothetical protein
MSAKRQFMWLWLRHRYFRAGPLHTQIPRIRPDQMSFSHGGAKGAAEFTPAEIAKLPPSERRPNTCARQRTRSHLLLVDGRMIYDAVLQPTGLWGDGPARTYQKFAVPAGRHTVEARMRDSVREQGFDYENRRADLKQANLRSTSNRWRFHLR